MTTTTRRAHAPAWVLAFLAAVLAAVLGLFTAGPASAATDSTAQNAVGASTPTAQVAVGASASITAGQRLGNDPPQPRIVVATGVAANTEMTTLFRSVGPGEAADIAATGTFNNAAGINVKYFATTADDAATWGNFLNPGESTIVTTRVPTSALDGAMFEPRWDGIGPAWILDSAQLGRLNQAMNGISVVR